ncbi:hypothetical protein D9758_000622 [Tetrapyrgos nigripes]|uniref:Uncharacterized protein n=1 Tax=Tetrapyrgos nigripes TaxID=182062 RepID=A0A8H5GZ34_9AGAR|nr:hypothetical protein D9758_000622 [Tetrapyrgos nigripes]
MAPSKNEAITDIPVPVPDSGSVFRTTLSPFFQSTTFTATSLKSSATSSSRSLTSYSSYPSTHQTLSSPYTYSTISHLQAQTSSSISAASSTAVSRTPGSTTSHKLPVVIIALIAVGSAFLIVTLFIIGRACTRPTNRARPKPSLPILEDPFDDDVYKIKESPLFGGAERFSSQTPLENPFETPGKPGVSLAPPVPALPPIVLDSTNELSPMVANRPAPSKSVPNIGPVGQRPPAARTVPNRLSVRSLSFYPTSPVPSNEKAYTADGHHVLDRNSKALLRTQSRFSVGTRSSSVELAYDGVDVTSPQFLAQYQEAPLTSTAGRSKVKSSYYTPGSYPRISSLPSTSSKIKTDDVDYPLFDLDQLPPIHPALASPRTMETVPLSPQPTLTTLGPDDSLSVVEKRPVKKAVPFNSESHIMSPTMDTSTVLGSLMLADFGTTTKSLSSRLGESNGDLAKGRTGLHSDRPPRVPSPPALPSLAQMGLENMDPVAYASYRSPTYSIFGMYEADRKSRASCGTVLDK